MAAIVVLMVGAFRVWRLQNALLRGKVRAGGWEVGMVGGLVCVVSSSFFFFGVLGGSFRDV